MSIYIYIKKEIRDQKTVISCLRKKIAFSKHSRHAVQDLDQFVELPRALCNADGLPEKGQKSTAATVSKDLYTEAFLSKLSESIQSIKTCVIIDGMLIINTSPLLTNKTFQVSEAVHIQSDCHGVVIMCINGHNDPCDYMI